MIQQRPGVLARRTLGTYSSEWKHIHTKIGTWIFSTAILMIAKDWKLMSINRRMDKQSVVTGRNRKEWTYIWWTSKIRRMKDARRGILAVWSSQTRGIQHQRSRNIGCFWWDRVLPGRHTRELAAWRWEVVYIWMGYGSQFSKRMKSYTLPFRSVFYRVQWGLH